MTTPDNPYGNPEQNPPPPPGSAPLPSYGQPQYGQPPAGQPYGQPAYGQPAYGQPAYGQPAPYGQAPYGQMGPGVNYDGTLVAWPMRAASSLLDGVIPFLPAWILVAVGAAAKAPIIGILAILAAWAYTFYNLYQQGVTGQTIGKRICGTYCVRETDGQYIGGGMSILRFFCHIVDYIPCFLGFLWPLWDAKKQTFADKIVGTVVVSR